MDNSFWVQLAAQAPMLLVEMAGMALAVIYWRRWPAPCLLSLCGTSLMLAVSLGRAFLFQFVVRAQMNRGWNHAQIGTMIGLVSLGSSLVYALGLGLVLAAVFVGRREKWDRLE